MQVSFINLQHTQSRTKKTVLRLFFRDHLGEPAPEKNFWTLWCKGRLTEAETQTIWLGTTPSRLTIAHLHHPPRQWAIYFYQPKNHCISPLKHTAAISNGHNTLMSELAQRCVLVQVPHIYQLSYVVAGYCWLLWSKCCHQVSLTVNCTAQCISLQNPPSCSGSVATRCCQYAHSSLTLKDGHSVKSNVKPVSVNIQCNVRQPGYLVTCGLCWITSGQTCTHALQIHADEVLPWQLSLYHHYYYFYVSSVQGDMLS